ncbi:peptidase M20 domain-containing protein 2-like isoform X1 [Physella acuta]|uniref:peptidase M20 domain-containing protein 2-like isoform X1 n=1 Tax=Physella acuta TaxID=109671 RepID=UPI0027DAC8B8|nr:peptidase M20 domain-containing protein 2-like isoform X1 [Physella acuta]XP_059157439.1 peptidase M20 domain-containing protein 2-like isoform X1 [Physella acuta]XP_059157440.1 peptidase M20 domain-containing protein 2-like isoform X1 [Physella acuta]
MPKKNPVEEKEPILTEEKKIAFTAIEQQLDELNNIGKDIWRQREKPGKEFKCHDRIVRFLKRKGFKVIEKYKGFKSAFRAEFGEGEVGGVEHPNIGFLCQYDADEATGHSRGHNLVTVVALTAALGLQTVIKFATEPIGMVTVIGCPGHPDNTGKIAMFDEGCFKGIDFLLSAYPSHYTNVKPHFIGAQMKKVVFRGRSRAEGDRPWEVANPVNAAVLAYQNVAAIRQQFKDDWIVKGVISDGGTRADVMPEYACMEFMTKAPKPIEMKIVGEMIQRCFEAAAIASGCRFETEVTVKEFLCNVTCNRLVELYKHNAALMGFTFHNKRKAIESPDDIANVSTSIPTLKVFYYAGTSVEIGTDEFSRYAGSKECEFMSIVQGKALAMMAIDLMISEENMKEVFEEHQAELVKLYESAGIMTVEASQQ